MCLGCVVRVESIEQDSMMSLWMSLTRGMRPGHSLRVYSEEATLWDGCAVEAWGVGYPL